MKAIIDARGLRIVHPIFLTLAALIALEMGGCPATEAEPTRSPRDPLRGAVNRLYNLEYDAAREQLQTWLSSHPTDLRALNQLATVLLHREMFLRKTLQTRFYADLGEVFHGGKVAVTPSFQQQFFGVLEKAQRLAEDHLKQNPKDQEAMYWAGAAHATRAVFYFSMLKAYLPALRESIGARQYHAQLLAINPDYVDAWLVVGTNDYVAGSLPWYVKIMASLKGYRGNRAQGLAEVKRVAEQGHSAREDAKFILAILYRREKMYSETLAVLQSLAESYPRNFLLRREIAQIQRSGVAWRAAELNEGTATGIQPGEAAYRAAPVFKGPHPSPQDAGGFRPLPTKASLAR